MWHDMAEKTVLVTGASKGIGRAIALGAAEAGANVVVNYCSDRVGADGVVEAAKQIGRKATCIQADISRVVEIRRMFEQIEEQFDGLDVLINNAGITSWTSLFETTEEHWDRCIDTNLKGTFFCSLSAARLMREREVAGSIVNVSSNCAALGVRNLSVYAASKGGIHALTKQLAVELAPYKIRVNTFAPGPTRVDRNLKDDPDYDSTWGAVVPLERSASAEEMIGSALFLASEQSSYVTGQLFYVDGGWSISGKIPSSPLMAKGEL